MKKVLIMFASVALSVASAVAASAEIQNVRPTVAVGEWTSDYYAAKAFAEANGVAMLAIWSSPGCGYCNKMKNALNSDVFVAWRKAHNIVFAVVEGDQNIKPDLKNASGEFPYMRFYWPAANIDKKFSGRAKSIPGTATVLEDKLIAYLESLMTGTTVSDVVVSASTDPVFTVAQMRQAGVTDANGNLVGAVSLKIGKGRDSGSKKGYSKVSGTFVSLEGKSYAIVSKEVKAVAWPVAATLEVKKLGSLNVSLGSDGGLLGTLEGVGTLLSAGTIGEIANGNHVARLTETPVVEGGVVAADLLPNQAFSVSGNLWTFPKAASVSLKDGKVVANTDNGRTNVSGIKLKVAKKTGIMKGSFKLYAVVNGRLKKYNASVKGIVVGGFGAGVATIRGVGAYPIVVE